MSEDKRYKQIQQGHQARAISEPLRLAGERYKTDLHERLMKCPVEDMDRVRQAIIAIDEIVKKLDNFMNDGNLAQHQLDVEQDRNKMYGGR
jgi:hypothetical protein